MKNVHFRNALLGVTRTNLCAGNNRQETRIRASVCRTPIVWRSL